MKLASHLLSIGLALLVAGCGPAHGGEPALPALDGPKLFAAYCASTAAKPAKALADFGDGRPGALRVPDHQVRELHEGRAGGLAWAIRGDDDAALLLEFDPQGMCIVRVAEADEKVTWAAFAVVAETLAARLNGQVTWDAPRVRFREGIRTTYRLAVIRFGQRYALLAITTAERPIPGMQQHMMSITGPQSGEPPP